jgi:uncharacterized lipoprotein YajG
LNVAYEEARSAPGVLSGIGPRQIAIHVTDARSQQESIGRKGSHLIWGPIVTVRPVSDVVYDALAVEFRKNGHRVVSAEASRVLTVEMTEFALTLQTAFTTRLVGTVAITVTTSAQMDGQAPVRRYRGAVEENTAGGLHGWGTEQTWTRVMNAALEQVVRDVATDPRLAQVLR